MGRGDNQDYGNVLSFFGDDVDVSKLIKDNESARLKKISPLDPLDKVIEEILNTRNFTIAYLDKNREVHTYFPSELSDIDRCYLIECLKRHRYKILRDLEGGP